MMSEIELWKQRTEALIAGEPWEEYPVGTKDGRILTPDELTSAIEDGSVRYCGPCSTPHSPFYHDRLDQEA